MEWFRGEAERVVAEALPDGVKFRIEIKRNPNSAQVWVYVENDGVKDMDWKSLRDPLKRDIEGLAAGRTVTATVHRWNEAWEEQSKQWKTDEEFMEWLRGEVDPVVTEALPDGVKFRVEVKKVLGSPQVRVYVDQGGVKDIDWKSLHDPLKRDIEGLFYGQPVGVMIERRNWAQQEQARAWKAAVEAKDADAKERQARIDEQWVTLAPGWGMKVHKGERKMLADILEDGEVMEQLIGGSFGPDLGHASWKDGPNTLHTGIACATNRRLIFVDKGIMASEVAEMPYSSIEAVTYSSGIRFAGLGIKVGVA